MTIRVALAVRPGAGEGSAPGKTLTNLVDKLAELSYVATELSNSAIRKFSIWPARGNGSGRQWGACKAVDYLKIQVSNIWQNCREPRTALTRRRSC